MIDKIKLLNYLQKTITDLMDEKPKITDSFNRAKVNARMNELMALRSKIKLGYFE